MKDEVDCDLVSIAISVQKSIVCEEYGYEHIQITDEDSSHLLFSLRASALPSCSNLCPLLRQQLSSAIIPLMYEISQPAKSAHGKDVTAEV